MNNPFLIRQDTDQLERNREFQSQANLTAIRAESFSARRAEQEPKIEEGISLDLKHSGKGSHVKGTTACFRVELSLDATGDRDPGKFLFHIEAVFALEFQLARGFTPTQAHIDAVESGNALFLCWPYVREFVQNATSRMGLSLPPIPLMRLVPPKSGGGEATVEETNEVPPNHEGDAPTRKAARKKRSR